MSRESFHGTGENYQGKIFQGYNIPEISNERKVLYYQHPSINVGTSLVKHALDIFNKQKKI